jgi:hypothetical protein
MACFKAGLPACHYKEYWWFILTFCKDVSKHDNSRWALLISLNGKGVALVSARLCLL